MADIDKILALVAEGKLSAEEADEIIAALMQGKAEAAAGAEIAAAAAPAKKSTALRIQITDGSRQVVNLRVPINVAGWASNFLPGLSDQVTERIRGAVADGTRGTILDITDDDGNSRVLITSD